MSEPNGYANNGALVSTEWLAQNLGAPGIKLIEVDVNPAAYEGGHIQGAVGWDWKRDLQERGRAAEHLRREGPAARARGDRLLPHR